MKNVLRLLVPALCTALVACAHQSVPSTASSSGFAIPRTHEAAALPFSVVYTFKGGSDGKSPAGGLIDVHGALYGTTASGGGSAGLGTVFELTPQGRERVVYRFVGGPNGDTPNSGLTFVKGTLFGLTSAQLFALAPTGASYRASSAFPSASAEGPLVSVKGRLYGVTRFGGLQGKGCTDRCGSVFVSTLGGATKTLYTFRGGADGGEPAAGLIAVKGNLYGTTLYGGTHGAGTVFELTPSGQHRVLFSFNPKTDGAQPVGTLYESGGTLYGTTEYQGANDSGTMFAVTLSGHASIVRQFGSGQDASNPSGSLVEVKGVFYGTSSFGGTHNSGTLFGVDAAGNERALYSFGSSTAPQAGLTVVGGALYGATGAAGKPGAGTIFKVVP